MAIYRVPTENNSQYTLDTQFAQGGATMTLNQSVSSIVRAPGICVIDRVDSSGNKTASKREYVSFTGVSGAQLTGVTRGLAGSSDQVHSVGAIVEFVPDVVQENAWYTWATLEHTTDGVHASLPSISYLKVSTRFDASGASVTGITVSTAITPVWVLPGNTSSASVSMGKPLDMPKDATIGWASVILRSPASGCSLIFDINKNFTTIFTDQNTRLSILGGGTFVSTASISVKAFNQGDVFSVDLDAGGNYSDATLKIYAI